MDQHGLGAASPLTERPFVSIIVPTLNEADYIGPCLDTLIQASSRLEHEILVVDGGSTDATKEIVRRRSANNPAIRLLDNPERLQSAAVNLGAEHASARAEIILRADAHACYPAHFVADCVAALISSAAASVVVPMANHGATPLQRAIAAAQSSRFGNGGAAHRVGAQSRFVDHGHHAAFNRASFLRLGGYNPHFTHNEDAEFDIRLVRAGERIWMCHTAVVTYFPRKSLGALARQYRRHGDGRARTLLLHGMAPKPRQMAPVAALLLCLVGLALAPVAPAVLLLPAGYAAICVLWAGALSLRQRDPWLLAAAPAAIVMHMGWAYGFIVRQLRERRHRITPRSSDPGLQEAAR